MEWTRNIYDSLNLDSNRNACRKRVKRRNRAQRVRLKIEKLLLHCPSAALTEEVISIEEAMALQSWWIQAMSGTIDYFPVPKVLHNKLRKYIHNHPHFQGNSLLVPLMHNNCLDFITIANRLYDVYNFSI